MDKIKNLLEEFIHDGYQSYFLRFLARHHPRVKLLTGLVVDLDRHGTHIERGPTVFISYPTDYPIAPDGSTGFINTRTDPNKGTKLFGRREILKITRDNDQLYG